MIVLPFPPSSLSGHAKGHWRSKSGPTAKHRDLAVRAVSEANVDLPQHGDIRIHIHFVPPDRRGDRCNFWNRCKPYIDGIAEALGVNDNRFLPSKSFAAPEKPGRVEVTIGEDGFGDKFFTIGAVDALEKNGPSACGNTMPGPEHQRCKERQMSSSPDRGNPPAVQAKNGGAA